MDDARLCIEVLRTAALHGARVANYVEAVAFEAGGVRAADRVGGKELSIRARQILNATGPWVDAVCRLAGDTSGPNLQPTKGVHLVVRDLGLSAAFLLLHPDDGRVFFVIPWLGKTLLGTTDTFTDEPADTLTVTDEEVRYLLAGYGRYFSPALRPRDVLGTFVGLRPLIRARSGDPSSLTREFRLWRSPSGLLNVAGGKYTTYRRMAEVVTNAVMRGLGLPRRSGRTREFCLDGAAGPRELHIDPPSVAAHLSEAAWQHLLARYGRRAYNVAASLADDPSLAQPVVAGEPELRVELVYQRRHEMVLFPEDFLLRRTRLGLFHPRLCSLSLNELLGQESAGARSRTAGPTVP
jgi:glycerol-3-phosphate dehydrogenase